MTQTTLLDAPEEKSEALAPQPPDLVLMFERLAKDPAVDVAKLEKLIDLQERIMKHNAAAAFNGAFALMQPDIPQIDERGKIVVKGQLRSTYATLEDIHDAVKPILARHGFAIRHRTEWPTDGSKIIRIVGILSHREGHSEESTFEAPADKSDFRSDIQSMGSTVSYGRRYTTLDLLNISTRGLDNDGQRTQREPEELKVPKGFEDWWDDIQAVAAEGFDRLNDAWTKSPKPFVDHLMATNRGALNTLKAKARQAKP